MNGWVILFLVVWSIFGAACASEAFCKASDDGANWKQMTYIGFFLGPLVWVLAVFFGVIAMFVWIYEFLGKKPSTKAKK